MIGGRWQVNVRDANRRLVGVLDDFDTLELVLRHNLPGSWAISGINRDHDMAAQFSAGAGVVIDMDDTALLSGPMLRYRRERVVDDGFVRNLLTVGGADDAVWLWRRQVHPSPSNVNFATAGYDVETGAAETVMHTYVDDNAGPSAVTWRRVAGLTLGVDEARGATVTGRARLGALGDLLASLAVQGGGLGFQVVQDGTDLVFSVYEPADRSASVELSDDVGNLGEFAYEVEAPTLNQAWVGGGGELTARTFVERTDSVSISEWGRVEGFVDQRQTTDTAELAAAGDEAIETGGEKVTYEIGAVDLSNLAFGVDYGLGDQITAVVDGVPVVQVIREVHVTVTAETEEIVPVLGTPGATGTADVVGDLFDRLKRLDRRVTNVERR